MARRLWDIKNARCLGSVRSLNTHQHSAWDNGGTEILYLDELDNFSVISASSLKVMRSGRYRAKLNSFCFSTDGSMLYVVAATRDLQVRSDNLFLQYLIILMRLPSRAQI